MNWDEAMHYVVKEMDVDAYALARTCNLYEEFGQIKYVLSDGDPDQERDGAQEVQRGGDHVQPW